jgi:hypothetical protein
MPSRIDINCPGTDYNERIYNPVSGCYEAPTREPKIIRGRSGSRPIGDGSRVFWRYAYWTVEAYDFDRAWVEVRRLCRECHVTFLPGKIRAS